MRVFHFRDEKFGLKSLEEKRLKIARIDQLNDPFEFFAAELSDRERRWAFKKTKADLSESNGILCFSKSWQNPVQWSHYADQHKGICMEFEIPNKHLMKVKYKNNRISCSHDIDEAMMRSLLTTKFAHWQYEEEYRAFVKLEPEMAENGLYFLGFSENLILKRVIVGSESSLTRTLVLGALGKAASKVEVFKARPAFKSFKIVRNKNELLWQ